MSDIWWYLSRSSGIVATVLIVAALMWGFFFSARATGTRRRPKWWLDLHNYLGGLAFVFVIVHIVAVYQDQLSGIGVLQVVVPMTASGWAWGITWGVLATYVFALVVFTSWPRKRGSRRVWLTIHLMSAPAAVVAGVHAWMVGSSRGQLWFSVLLVALVGLAVYPAVLRILTAVAKRSARRVRSPDSAIPAVTIEPIGPATPPTRPSMVDEPRSRTREFRAATVMSTASVAGMRRVEHHMGTAISLQTASAPADAADRFFAEIGLLEAKFSRFRHDSEVMRLERGELALDDASPQVREVLVRCEALRSSTGGAFDHRPIVDRHELLDPNAFAKGWIIEQAVLHLQFAGVSSYFVNAGGDVVVGTPPPGRTSWHVGITHPGDRAAVFATVDLAGAAVATSGRYERGNHIRCTTHPGQHPLAATVANGDELASVSVVGPELATADALATAVFASGEPRPSWWDHDSPYGIIAATASGRVRYTDNLAEIVHVGQPVPAG